MSGFGVPEEAVGLADDYSMIISTFPDVETARKTAKMLVEKRLAACAQMLPIHSVYAWQGKVCEDDEVALLIKSKTALFDKVASAIRDNHGYEVPEIIQLTITAGLPDYLHWIDENVDDMSGGRFS